MPELLDSHKILGIKGHGLRPKVDFEWLWRVLTTFWDMLEEWKNDTTIEKLERENKTLAMDVKVYKRHYEGEIAKCRELGEELKVLKASSMLAPVVPARVSSVSGNVTPSIASVRVPGTSKITGSGFGAGVENPVAGMVVAISREDSTRITGILGGCPRRAGNRARWYCLRWRMSPWIRWRMF